MTYRLLFTNDWDDRWTEKRGQQFYLATLGAPWPSDKHPNRRMIERTCRDKAQAKEFASVQECRETLVLCGQPRGWQVVDENGAVIE
jgi:hypothetical protein